MRMVDKNPIMLSASVSCMNLINMEADLEKIHASQISFLHFDVVDGAFNDCIILGTPTLEALRKHTHLPIEVHLAVYKPENFIPQYIDAGADYLSFHAETQGIDETLDICDRIRMQGALPTLALRVETLLDESYADVLKNVEWVLKLLVQPGYSGQKISEGALNNLRGNARTIRSLAPGTGLQADGNVNANTIPEIIRAGANILTGGTSGLFLNGDIAENARAMLHAAESAME